MLLRYGELALKSPPVRREFERTLSRNILDRLRDAGISCHLRADHGHLYVTAQEDSRLLPILRTVFGITSLSEVRELPSDPAMIESELLRVGDSVLTSGQRFAVRTRRVGSHSFTSQELARTLGAALLRAYGDRGIEVDLTHPTVEFSVEVRGPRTYVSLGRSAGPGGLPLGVAGRLVALVDGPRGALGAYLMMKRGCRVAVVADSLGGRYVSEVLRRFDPALRSESPAPSAEEALQKLVVDSRADGVVLPLSVEGYPEARERWGNLVLFSPTVGLDDQEVSARWLDVERLAQ